MLNFVYKQRKNWCLPQQAYYVHLKPEQSRQQLSWYADVLEMSQHIIGENSLQSGHGGKAAELLALGRPGTSA